MQTLFTPDALFAMDQSYRQYEYSSVRLSKHVARFVSKIVQGFFLWVLVVNEQQQGQTDTTDAI